jgi:hypothetical protein
VLVAVYKVVLSRERILVTSLKLKVPFNFSIDIDSVGCDSQRIYYYFGLGLYVCHRGYVGIF